MYEQRNLSKIPIVAGFSEGLVMPIIELLISYMVIALSAISSATGAPNLSWFFVVFASADLLRNVVGCLLHTQYAIGRVAGSIFGIAICYGSISLISKEIATVLTSNHDYFDIIFDIRHLSIITPMERQ